MSDDRRTGSPSEDHRIPGVVLDGRRVPVGRIFCIGRNYDEHVREMGGRGSAEPVVFLKPASCLVDPGGVVPFPPHGDELHHEVELVLLLAAGGEGWSRVRGVGLGLDLTLRDVQAALKETGRPWEPAKAFEASAPVGELVAPPLPSPAGGFEFECRVDGELRQRGNSEQMVFDVPTLIGAIGAVWTLRPDDLVFTGTPAGVGPLRVGQRVTISGDGLGEWSWTIGPRQIEPSEVEKSPSLSPVKRHPPENPIER